MTKQDKTSITIGLLGLCALVTGVSLVSIPAGCVVGGVCLMAWSYMLAKTGAK